MKFEVFNRFTGQVQFTAEIDSAADAPRSVKLGLAVKWAVKTRANLAGANLSDAYLAGANLADANLADAYLAGANLSDAYLAGANLAGAYLADANLADANLAGANLAGANLADAYLAGAKNAELAMAQTVILPEGDLIGWKKAGGRIVKLRIPADARRSNSTSRKCRAEFADVLEIEGAKEATSERGGVYRVGERIYPDSWDENRWNECSHGIHFFITKEEAGDWQ